MPDQSFAPQFVSARHRDETAELGMWVFIATEVLLFGGLLLAWFVYRDAYPDAVAAGSRRTEVVIGTANTAILLTSSFLVACAVDALRAGARRLCVIFLVGAIVLGLAFLTLKGIEYTKEYHERLVPGIRFAFEGPLANGVELFFIFYFISTAIHALHMTAGIAMLATLTLLLHKSANGKKRAALHSAALYWHFVDVVWIFLFALIYLPGRSS